MAGVEVRAAHQRMGKPDASWPRLPAPESTGAMTVFDVAAAGAMVDSVTGHAEAVRIWAATVWRAWASQHAAVAALADRTTAQRIRRSATAGSLAPGLRCVDG